MISYVRRAALGAVTAAACAVALSAPAAAINSYNSSPAPERTEVGALVAQYDHDSDPATPDVVEWMCSGTMIADDVFLTAAHCTSGAPEGTRFGVSLAQDTQAVIDAYSKRLSGGALFDKVAAEGTAHSHPGYPGTSANSYDIAVLTFTDGEVRQLNQQSGGFTPAELPTKGLLDQLGPQGLDRLEYTIVGYGSQEAQRRPGGHVYTGGGVRMKAPTSFNALNDTWLRLSMIGAQDNGGACYGDSGGPNFAQIGGELVLVGTTITGDVPCYATNVTYRLDTPTARDFLDDFVALP